MEKQILYYRIAELLLEISCPISIDYKRCLPSFLPFQTERKEQEPILAAIVIKDMETETSLQHAELLSDVSVIWGERFKFYQLDNAYITRIAGAVVAAKWEMHSTLSFQSSAIYYLADELYTTTTLSWLIMINFAQACLAKNTLLLHASVVEQQQEAYAFLGPSGTGKSTHSALWIANIPGFSLLNDDNPAVQLGADGKVYIYGTPWSGKTPCYRNEKRSLKGVVRLRQARENNFKRVYNMDALISLLPSGSALRWNAHLYTAMTDTLVDILKIVPVGQLDCLPNIQAAHLCFNELKK